MTSSFKLPPFGKFLDQLRAAGVETRTARGFWGGRTKKGEIVVTAWTHEHNDGQFPIWEPATNHGGLKDCWDVGLIRPGAEVKLILLRRRGNQKVVAAAALMPGKWRVVEVRKDRPPWPHAMIEPA